MALWKEKEPDQARNESLQASSEPAANERKEESPSRYTPSQTPAKSRGRESMESVIGSDLTIEGKIEGSGHVRLVGKFKGDVHVDGDLTIEPGAKVTGSVRAGKVVIGGELEGNIDSAESVELLETAVVNGDLTSRSLTVASGSRMRGQAEFGWEEREARVPRPKAEAAARQ